MASKIVSHRDLDVYQKALTAALAIFDLSKSFPSEERFSLVDQIRRASRSVCANLAEAWRRRRYPAAFVNKLNEAEAEAAETQVWLEFAVRSGYVAPAKARGLYRDYENVLRTLVGMILHSNKWTFPTPSRSQ